MNRIRSRDMRGLFFHDGWWWVDVRINGRRYREPAGATESKARAYRDDLKAWGRAVRKKMPAEKPEGAAATFDALAADYLRLYASRKKSFLRDKRCMDNLKSFFKGRLLRDIDLRAVAEYQEHRSGVKASSRNRELACLKTALRWAVEAKLLRAYPLPAKGLMEKTERFKPYILSLEEAHRLVGKASPDWLRQAIIVYLYSGLRKRELLDLKREDVDFKNGLLTVVAENAKSGKARTITMAPLVINALRAMTGKTYFLENPETGKPFTDIIHAFKMALAAAEVPLRCRIHDLRHTYGTWQIREGTDPKTLSELMGHANAMITLGIYCTPNLEDKRRAAAALPDVVGSGQELQTEGDGVPASASDSVN